MKRYRIIRIKDFGFTLIELIVVLAILSILLFMAVPSFMGWTPRSSLKRATRDIVSSFEQARMESVKRNKTWAVEFDPIADEYKILSDYGGDEETFRTVSLSGYRNISFGTGYGGRPGATNPADGVSFTGNRVIFNPNGTSKSGTVYIMTANMDTFAVGCLSNTGRIKTWCNYGSGWKE